MTWMTYSAPTRNTSISASLLRSSPHQHGAKTEQSAHEPTQDRQSQHLTIIHDPAMLA
jgi:hypothetical protein